MKFVKAINEIISKSGNEKEALRSLSNLITENYDNKDFYFETHITIGSKSKRDETLISPIAMISFIAPKVRVNEYGMFSITDRFNSQNTVTNMLLDNMSELHISPITDKSVNGWGDSESEWERFSIEFRDVKSGLDYRIELQVYTDEGINKISLNNKLLSNC